MPYTFGSFAVYTSSYKYAGLKPPLRQIFLGSGAPGNGVLLQSANAHSVLRKGMSLPSSDARRVSVALDVSSVAGSAVPATPPRRIGNVVASGFMSLNLASTGPV